MQLFSVDSRMFKKKHIFSYPWKQTSKVSHDCPPVLLSTSLKSAKILNLCIITLTVTVSTLFCTHLTYITLEIFKGDQKKSGAKPKGLQLSKDQITSSQRGILIYKLVWDWNKWGFCFCHMFFFVTVLLNLICMSYESTRKGSSVATPKGIFYKIQWAWQGVKLTQ